MDPSALLLDRSFNSINTHYQYTEKDLDDGTEEEDKGDLYGDALEEEYMRNMANESDTDAN